MMAVNDVCSLLLGQGTGVVSGAAAGTEAGTGTGTRVGAGQTDV